MFSFSSPRGAFPHTRLRRTRMQPFLRKLVCEHTLSVNDLVAPLFISATATPTPIDNMPGLMRHSSSSLLSEIESLVELGIPAIALFPAIDPTLKTDDGSYAYNSQGLIQTTIRDIKQRFPELGIFADVALDPYTTHGQDGLIDDSGTVLNDETLEALCKQSVSLAESGADVLAPSDMMDGRVNAIRQALDSNGFSPLPILSYAAKYVSAFYGPFRNAVGSDSCLLNKGKDSYQMQPSNSDEALHEVSLDLSEGADMVMIKPGMPYLDIVARVKEAFRCPTFVYQVSGEYSMLCHAFDNGTLSKEKTILESLLSFKRAGADAIFTYFAKDAARLL